MQHNTQEQWEGQLQTQHQAEPGASLERDRARNTPMSPTPPHSQIAKAPRYKVVSKHS